MIISADAAATVFRKAASEAEEVALTSGWAREIEHLSKLCELASSLTHIAFLGTAILARSVDARADLRAIKPSHAKENLNAYSARALCHSTLVPLAAELGVSLGVSGREPLNNQPYFRMKYLGDGTPVRAKAKPAFDYMSTLIDKLQASPPEVAREALRAFISVRRRYQIIYPLRPDTTLVSWINLPYAITALIAQASEGGRRAQAAVAGIVDVAAGVDRVESGRINDPSRHYPGDVAIRGGEGWLKAIEVRDKPVAESDIYIFGQSCLERDVADAAVVMLAPGQSPLENRSIIEWAAARGLGMTMFYGIQSFVEQALFWSNASQSTGAGQVVERIEKRLIAVEASPEAIAMWHELTQLSPRLPADGHLHI